jgi:LPXTG-motif cell wall-anchored protein
VFDPLIIGAVGVVLIVGIGGGLFLYFKKNKPPTL